MNTKNIMSVVLLNQIKDKGFLSSFFTNLILNIAIFLFISLSNDYEGMLSSIIILFFVIINISIYQLITNVVLYNISINEKISSRLEFYLANKIPLNDILNAYSISTFILSSLSTISFTLVILLMTLIFKLQNFVQAFWNLDFVAIFLALLIFFYLVAQLLNIVVFISKKISTIRMIIAHSSLFVLLLGVFGSKYMIKSAMYFNISFNLAITITLLGFSLIILFFVIALKRNCTKEKIVLSTKE